jgi:hypothetical protein
MPNRAAPQRAAARIRSAHATLSGADVGALQADAPQPTRL